MLETVVVSLLAVFCGGLGTYFARAFALRIGLTDCPDGRRKIHANPVALAGGIGVFSGVLAALGISAALYSDLYDHLTADLDRSLALLASAAIITLVGLVDDWKNLRARYKLVGQIAAAMVLVVFGGFQVETVTLFGKQFPLGMLAAPAAVAWLVLSINAVNLLDGMDGFLGTVGVVACGALAAMAFARGNPFVGWVGVAMAGSLVGFLRFNLPPATVYLGDAGSHLVGLIVGAAALMASLKGPTVAIVAPAVLLVLPVLDTTAAIVRRKLTGRGLAQADRGHLHHVLQRNGLTPRRILILVACLGGIAGAGAMVSVTYANDFIALAAGGAVVMILLAGGLFGNAEFRLIRERFYGMVRQVHNGDGADVEVRLQGVGNWRTVWHEITRTAEELNLTTVRLDVNAPAWHEGYHRRWDRGGQAIPEYEVWRVELPLFGCGQVLGRLTVIGKRDGQSITEKLAILTRLALAVETQAALIADTVRTPLAVAPPTEVTHVTPPNGVPVLQRSHIPSLR